jgi:fatty-acyl-CoA synthase
VRVLGAAGVIRPAAPRRLAAAALTLAKWGPGLTGGFVAQAMLSPHRTAVVDELGELTFAELDDRSNRLADALRRRGVAPGDPVAVMCRNHRGFVEASLAVGKLGADVVYLNTAFGGPQLAEVLERERPRLLVHDAEFSELLAGAAPCERALAWVDPGAAPDGTATVESMVQEGRPGEPAAPPKQGRVVILTSGTTGAPKGAPRSGAGIAAATALLSRLPLRSGWRCHVAAPLFHTWGWAHFALALVLGSTLVLRRRFDPETCLRTLVEDDCDCLVAIPVMLQRVLRLPAATLDRYDLSRVEVVAVSGSALPGDLSEQWMDRFGEHLYNVYGSTEVAYATIATPADLREAPGTAGRPPYATVVKVLDERGLELPRGEVGRIFVANSILFEGYSGGGRKEVVGGLMATGDLGRLDSAGRLVVEGRDDEMIVSGGENVFPAEVEDCLSRHEQVVEAAAVGVADEQFGQRLRAFVVLAPGATVGEEELKDHVRRHLARYKVPREVVVVDRLPRNATGKVLKRELRDPG